MLLEKQWQISLQKVFGNFKKNHLAEAMQKNLCSGAGF